jgi:hypothetical protein
MQPGCRIVVLAGANGTGSGTYFNYYLSCTVPVPIWINRTNPTTTLFNTSRIMPFPAGFRFTINGTVYTRVAFNRFSGYVVFVPDNGTEAEYSREIMTPTYVIGTCLHA